MLAAARSISLFFAAGCGPSEGSTVNSIARMRCSEQLSSNFPCAGTEGVTRKLGSAHTFLKEGEISSVLATTFREVVRTSQSEESDLVVIQ